ncbi:alpha/beta-Hydrolases superfamily protein [Rhynchospora pubera]|uniref:Alpha/beta-Hydrolases superfamily protein n=1 Tax=Rhynchospora pubera TaxID=906938 RepID=A0AAV8EP18_9POAL|nr:alpha/beta-Hydrolases superfamily protein [Rhynchospora pubera]KAJ4779852.1 alpha/beta-Hydrolases superfamily protein [Rhynchospora pubera]
MVNMAMLMRTALSILLFFSLFYIFSKDSSPPSSSSSLALHLPQRHSPIQFPIQPQTPSLPSPIQFESSHSHHEHTQKPFSILSDPPPGNDELQYDFSPYVKLYKSGRVERLPHIPLVPPGIHTFTGVNSKDVLIDHATGVSVRLYLPKQAIGTDPKHHRQKLPVLLYFHGGAFVIESAFSTFYHHFLNVLVSKAQVLAISVNYRLAPEHRLPAAYEDGWLALKWALNNCRSGPEPWLFHHGDINRVFLGGDSAGGNIAHDSAIRAGTVRGPSELGMKIKGLILLNPYFWGKDPVGTEPGDRWIRESFEKNWDFVCGGLMGIDHPAVNPLTWMEGLRSLGCERVIVTVAGRDFFRERGVAYVKALKNSGWSGAVQIYETKDEFHVYFISNPLGKKASEEMHAVVHFINRR